MPRHKRSETVKQPARLLDALRAARYEANLACADLKISGDVYQKLSALTRAIDDVAEAIGGDRELFWNKPHRIGGGG